MKSKKTVYRPVRCSTELDETLGRLAMQKHVSKSEVLRDLIDKGLTATGAKVEDSEFYDLIRCAVKETMQPQVERLAAISAKATHISSAAFFMSIFAATREATPAEQRQIEEAAGMARELGIQYLKLKDGSLDAFIREGAKKIMDESEE